MDHLGEYQIPLEVYLEEYPRVTPLNVRIPITVINQVEKPINWVPWIIAAIIGVLFLIGGYYIGLKVTEQLKEKEIRGLKKEVQISKSNKPNIGDTLASDMLKFRLQ